MKNSNPYRAGLLGLALGDALGVPVEFQDRARLRQNPVTGMRGYGTYNQPPGTWSDDTSLACCLAESLLQDFNLASMASRFISWRNYAHWTAHNEVFDIGITTNAAIDKLEHLLASKKQDELSKLHIGASEQSNGNGSLMRTFPLYTYIKNMDPKAQFIVTWEVSALTHGHVRAAFACWVVPAAGRLYGRRDGEKRSRFKACKKMANIMLLLFYNHQWKRLILNEFWMSA